MTDTPAPRLMRLAEVMERTALSRSAIYARISRDQFPPPYKLGYKCVRWSEADINAWITSHAH